MEDVYEFIGKSLITIGASLATVISYTTYHNILWAVGHGMLNWGFVIYTIIKAGGVVTGIGA